MTNQTTFADLEYLTKKRKTRREKFLEQMDGLIPWEEMDGLQPLIHQDSEAISTLALCSCHDTP